LPSANAPDRGPAPPPPEGGARPPGRGPDPTSVSAPGRRPTDGPQVPRSYDRATGPAEFGTGPAPGPGRARGMTGGRAGDRSARRPDLAGGALSCPQSGNLVSKSSGSSQGGARFRLSFGRFHCVPPPLSDAGENVPTGPPAARPLREPPQATFAPPAREVPWQPPAYDDVLTYTSCRHPLLSRPLEIGGGGGGGWRHPT